MVEGVTRSLRGLETAWNAAQVSDPSVLELVTRVEHGVWQLQILTATTAEKTMQRDLPDERTCKWEKTMCNR